MWTAEEWKGYAGGQTNAGSRGAHPPQQAVASTPTTCVASVSTICTTDRKKTSEETFLLRAATELKQIPKIYFRLITQNKITSR